MSYITKKLAAAKNRFVDYVNDIGRFRLTAATILSAVSIGSCEIDVRADDVAENRFILFAKTPTGRQAIERVVGDLEASYPDSARIRNLRAVLKNAPAAKIEGPTDCGIFGSMCEYLAKDNFQEYLSGERNSLMVYNQ